MTGGMITSFFPRLFSRRGIYSALDESAHEIRLLTLLPGKFSDTIRIVLKSIPFRASVSPVPEFEALSYVWGTTENPEKVEVTVSDRTTKSLIITKNLYELLPYLRYADRSRVLWIDAICINQQDLKERSEQVRRMTDIYSLASRVIVWLGPENDGSAEALNFMQSIGSKFTLGEHGFGIEPVPGESAEWITSPKRLLELNSRELSTVEPLLFRPWFERLWVQQEVQLAKDAIIICGTTTINFRHFRYAVYCLQAKAMALGIPLRNRATLIGDLFSQAVTGNLLDAIDYAKHCKCSDARDRVYALLGITTLGKEGLIEPDYSKSISDVYQEVVAIWMAKHKSLRPLLSCSLSSDDVEFDKHPTWVPNWSQPQKQNQFPDLLPGCWTNLPAYAEISPDNALNSMGIELSTVSMATIIGVDPDTVGFEIFHALRRLVPIESMHGDYIDGGTIFDAYCRLLGGGRFREDWSPPDQTLASEQKCKIALSKCLQVATPDYSDPWWEEDEEFLMYFSMIAHWGRGRSIIIAEDGRLGLAPDVTRPGDLVYVLLGCQYPIILRPIYDNSQVFRVVGECLLDGYLNGEAVLGRMPDHYKMVQDSEARLHGYTIFVDSRAGSRQIDDPRFRHVLGDGFQEWPRFVNEPWSDWRTAMMNIVSTKLGVNFTAISII